MNKLVSAMGLALGLWFAAAPVQAALYSFEDDDIEFILDAQGNVKTTGNLIVGDTFVSIFEIGVFTIDGVNAIPAGQELTGVAAVQLLAIVGTGGVGTQYIFGPTAAGLNAILALGTDPDATVTGGGAGGGAAVAMYFNSTSGVGGDRNLDLNISSSPGSNCTSLADCIDQASLGSLQQVDGFLRDPDEFWFAVQTIPGGGDIATVAATGNTTIIAAFNFALSTLFNATGPVGFINVNNGSQCNATGYVADGCVQLLGSGTISGGQGLENGAIAHSDFDAKKIVGVVPEPASLALLGIGLIGLGAIRRRRS